MKWGKIVIFSHFYINFHCLRAFQIPPKNIKVEKVMSLIAQRIQPTDYQQVTVQ